MYASAGNNLLFRRYSWTTEIESKEIFDGIYSVKEILLRVNKLVYAFTGRSRYNIVDCHFSKIFYIMTAGLSGRK